MQYGRDTEFNPRTLRESSDNDAIRAIARLRALAPETPFAPPVERWPGARAVLGHCIALACAAIAWIASLGSIDLRQINDLGLISVLPLAYFTALGLLTISFALAICNRKAPSWLLFLHVALLIAIVYGTPSLGYGTLRYAWAWKHIGMVDFIQRLGSVDSQIASLSDLSAYHNWPGFFALATLFTQAAGFSSALQFAALAPLFFNLLSVGALLLIMGAFVTDRRLKWLAVWFFFLANWIGQDYFSPQAMAYFLLLVIVGITLTWFSARPRAKTAAGRGQRFARFESFWHRIAGPDVSIELPRWKATPLQRVGLMAMIILMFGIVASSHQLTPFIAILSIGSLALACRTSARGLPLLMAVITLTWMIYFAWSFVGGNLLWMLDPFGELSRNSSLADVSRLSPGQVTVAWAARSLSAFVGLLAVVGLIRRWRRGRRDLAYLLLAIAPFPMLVASSYSGEMPYRVYYFALPYLAFFAAALFFPALTSGNTWRTPVVVVATSTVLVAGLMLAYYGHERLNYFTQNEVDAARYLYTTAPPNSLVIGATGNYPSLFQNYEQFSTITLTGRKPTKGRISRLSNQPLELISDLMGDQSRPSYVIITRSQKADIEMNGILPQGTIERIESLLTQSNDFKVVYANPDAEIFMHLGSGGGGVQ